MVFWQPRFHSGYEGLPPQDPKKEFCMDRTIDPIFPFGSCSTGNIVHQGHHQLINIHKGIDPRINPFSHYVSAMKAS